MRYAPTWYVWSFFILFTAAVIYACALNIPGWESVNDDEQALFNSRFGYSKRVSEAKTFLLHKEQFEEWCLVPYNKFAACTMYWDDFDIILVSLDHPKYDYDFLFSANMHEMLHIKLMEDTGDYDYNHKNPLWGKLGNYGLQ